MKRLLLVLLLLPVVGQAETLAHMNRYTGSGASDNATVIQTDDVQKFKFFCLKSTTGAMDVFLSADPDGSDDSYSTAPYSLEDEGATSTDRVIVTTANRWYCFVAKVHYVRVLQNGGTAVSNAVLTAGN